MPPLGTYLVGSVVFAGEHLVETTVAASGEAQADVSPSALRSGFCAGEGQASGDCASVQKVGGAVSGIGMAEGQIAGCVPVGFHVAGTGQADALIAPGIAAGALIEGKGSQEASVRWFPKFQGLGLRVEFVDPANFPVIKFKEVLP